MCDHESFSKLRERVHEIETTQGRFDEQLKTLFKSINMLYRVVLVAGLLLLLTVIYGAIGQRGFNAVTSAARQTHAVDSDAFRASQVSTPYP